MEMTKNEQDLIILAHIQALKRIPEINESYGLQNKRGSFSRHHDDDLKHFHMKYMFASIEVCQKFYFFVHDLGKKRFYNLVQHYRKEGLSMRIHKSTNKALHRSNDLGYEIMEEVVSFIKNYGETFGLPLPGRMPNERDTKAIKLPSADTKKRVYEKYCKAMSEVESSRIVGLSSFKNIWLKLVPHISPMKPSSDLCDTCRLNVRKIQRCVNTNDNDIAKSKALQEANDHLNDAKIQRSYYNEWRQKAKELEITSFKGVKGKFSVLSFDFAQQIHYPTNPQQVGPAFFKTARKCGIFGVHNERNERQTNYLIDEADQVGKGADCVISLLHAYLETIKADILILFADNCVGQNKNNALLHYLQWRVDTGRNKVIELNFMLAGHTKFGPDRGFGLIKIIFARTVVDGMKDMVVCVQDSSPNGFNLAIPTVDPDTGHRNVKWSKWSAFLSKFFKPFIGLTTFHHFFFSSEAMQYRLLADDKFDCMSLSKTVLDMELFPEEITPVGLSADRQWYLFDEIRNYCEKDESKDGVAPLPTVPRPPTKKTKKLVTLSSNSCEPLSVKNKNKTKKNTVIDKPNPVRAMKPPAVKSCSQKKVKDAKSTSTSITQDELNLDNPEPSVSTRRGRPPGSKNKKRTTDSPVKAAKKQCSTVKKTTRKKK